MNGGPRLADLRVAVDARYLASPGMGIHTYLVALLDLLSEEGADLTLLLDERPLPDPSVGDRFTTRRLDGSGLRWEQGALWRHLRENPYDLYLAPANRGVPVRPTRIPSLLVVHDLIPLVLWRTYLTRDLRTTVGYLLGQGISLLRATGVAAVSATTARDVRRLSGRRAAVVGQPRLPAARAAAAVRAGTLVHDAGVDPRKQVGLLLEAFALAARSRPELELVLVGAGYERHRDAIASLGIADRVVLTGRVDDEERDARVASAAALVLTSRYEGFGLPVVEAFALGTPVVCGSGGALREVGGDAVERVDVSDAAAVADGIVRVLDPERRARLVAAGREQLERLRAADGPGNLVASILRTARRGGPAGDQPPRGWSARTS